MSVECGNDAATYISDTGIIKTDREVERCAWKHSTPVDLTKSPVIIDGTSHYPVTNDSTFRISYTHPQQRTGQAANTELTTKTGIATDVKWVERDLQHDSLTTSQPTQDTVSQRTEVNTIQASFLTPHGRETRILNEVTIKTVEPVTTLADHFPVQSTNRRNRAVEIENYASLHPDAVQVTDIVDLFNHQDPVVDRAAVAALRHVVDDKPSACIPATHHLSRFLDGEQSPVAEDALYCLARIAQESPSDAVTASGNVPEYITCNAYGYRENALTVCNAVANNHSHIVEGYGSDLIDCLQASKSDRISAAKTLAELAATTPDTLTEFTPQLIDWLTTPHSTYPEKVAVMSTLARISSQHPEQTVTYTDEIATCLTSNHEKLKANAASALYDLAAQYSSTVATHTDKILPLLTDSTSYAKLNATGVLARLAQTHPEQIARYTDQILSCLESPEKDVRMNVCWIFQRLGSQVSNQATVIDKLSEITKIDSSEDVKLRADIALREITQDH